MASCSLCPAKEPTFTKAQTKKPASQRVCVDCTVRAEQIDNALKSQKLLLKILDQSTFALSGEKLAFPPSTATSKFSLQVDISFKCFNQDFILNFLASSLTPITVGVLRAQLLSEADLPKDFPVNLFVGGELLTADPKTLWTNAVTNPSALIELRSEAISIEEEILKLHYQRRKSTAPPGDDLLLLFALQCEPDFFQARALERVKLFLSKEIPRFSSKVLLEYLIALSPDPPFALHMMLLDLFFLFQVPYHVLDDQCQATLKFATDPDLRSELMTKKQIMNEKLNKDYWDTHNILAVLGPAMISRAIFPYLDLQTIYNVSRTSKGMSRSFHEDSFWETFCKRAFPIHMFGVKKSPSWKTLFYRLKGDSKRPFYSFNLDHPDPFMGKVDSTDRWVPIVDTCITHPDETTIPQLLAILQNISVRDINLHLILWRFLKKIESVKNHQKVDKAEWVRVLLEHGADPNLPHRNLSMLGYSISKGWLEVAKMLCLHGASLDHPTVPTCLEMLKKSAVPPEDEIYRQFHEMMLEKIAQREAKSALKYNPKRGWYHAVWGYPLVTDKFNILWFWKQFGFWPDARDRVGEIGRTEVRVFRHAPRLVVHHTFETVTPFERMSDEYLNSYKAKRQEHQRDYDWRDKSNFNWQG